MADVKEKKEKKEKKVGGLGLHGSWYSPCCPAHPPAAACRTCGIWHSIN
jgi:hypothetical protein